MSNKLAIIGGSGLYDVEEFTNRELIDLKTPWGKHSDKILKTNYKDKEIFFFTKTWKRTFYFSNKYKFQSEYRCFKTVRGYRYCIYFSSRIFKK